MKFNFLIAAICIANAALAQEASDVLMISQNQTGTSARSLGVGGAMGSIGADFGAANINPATLGKYSKNEFSFTPSFNVIKTNTTYLGVNATDKANKLNFQNIGLVLAKRRSNQYSGWKGNSFAIGFNKLANFDRTYTITGINNKNSIVNMYAEQANITGGLTGLQNGFNTSLESQLAYKAYLLDGKTGDSTNSVFSYVPFAGNLRQTKDIIQSGGINELSMSLAANNNDKLLIGATLGIPIVNIRRNFVYREQDISGNTNNDFDYMEQLENKTTSGAGINIKIGAVYMPTNAIRLGLALHTPTWYSLEDRYNFGITSSLENLSDVNGNKIGVVNIGFGDSNNQAANYTVSTPYKAVFSGSYVIGKNGFITADIDYIDYTSASLNLGKGYEKYSKQENDIITRIYKPTTNFRLGAEWRIGDLMLRGGYSYYGSPYNNALLSQTRNAFSAGAGLRTASFFIDGAVVFNKFSNNEYLYLLNNTASNNVAAINNNNTQVVLTLGWKY
jgi:hypothetical protein